MSKLENFCSKYWVYIYAIIVTVFLLARFIGLNHPGFEIDEPVYNSVASSVANGNGVAGVPLYPGTEFKPYIYHPPFYFFLAGGWEWIFGEGVMQLRVFSVLCSLVVLILAMHIMKKSVSYAAAGLAGAFLALDSWLIFQQRIGWIDNSLIILFMLTVIAWKRAEKTQLARHWAVLGLSIGGCFIYKHIGGTIVIGVFAGVLLGMQRMGNHKQRLVKIGAFAGAAAFMVLAYALIMSQLFPGYFLSQTTSQLNRVLGITSSRGTLDFTWSSVNNALHSNYWLFVATAIAQIAAFALIIRRAFNVFFKEAEWRGTRELAFIATGSLTVILLGGVRFPHYFITVFVPALMYLAAEVSFIYSDYLKYKWRLPATCMLVLLMLTSLAGSVTRLTWPNDDALNQTISYMRQATGAGDIVVTDETVGVSLDGARYCQSRRPGECTPIANWLTTYTSQTQELPVDPNFHKLYNTFSYCTEYKGFRETIKIYAKDKSQCLS